MAAIGASSRTCAQLGKAEPSTRLAPNARTIRLSRQAFKGSRRLVKVSAADEAAQAPVAEQQAAAPQTQQRGRRQQRTVTVDLASVKPGDQFEGTVTSVEAYGAFVNIGARTDGLVHVSQLTDGFVKNTADVVKVGDTVKVKVLTVDPAQSRLALSMKGMNPRARASAGQDADYEDDGDEGEEEVQLEDNEAVFEGTFFRVEDEDAIDEADEWEVEQDADVATAIALSANDMVSGRVVQVEDFGVIVEFEAGGKTLQGLLHVSEMAAPAARAGDSAEAPAPAQGGGLFADEAEFLEEEYEDVGGVDKPSEFYSVGDSISAFVLDVEGDRKISLTQFMSAEELMAGDEEDEEEADLLEQLDAQEGDDDALDFADGAEGEDAPKTPAYESGAVTAGVYYGMQRSYPERAVSGFIAGRRDGATVVPGAFPDRPVRSARDAGVRVPASLAQEDDDGEESELIEFWTDDSALPRNVLKRLGYKIQRDDNGEMEVVAREGEAAAAEGEEGESLYDLLNMADDADIDAIVDALMKDDDADEAELPYLAARRPVVFAMSVETAATISAADVKRLRMSTGVGMMDCKKALTECNGDFEKAAEWLRQKGLAGADKKAGRLAAEGVIQTYIHPGSRLGVIVEINCETDFVAASDAFQQLANEVCMVAASCDAVVVNVEDVPADLLAKEREVEMGKEDIKSKPEAVRAKIVEGRLDKIKRNFALTEQPALRDNNKTVAEVIKETIAQVGENIQIRRFIKYNLGEGLEKRSNDFAAEVAQQTQAKAKEEAKPKADKPKAEAPKAAAPAVAISAAVVKQLRDKSGAGMMDCKKALAECGGDMEAASEWLRKKGLASADKKAGRLAAEGAISAYIHPGSRLGVLLEVNCETDFVAASDQFRELLKGISMQIAATPSVQYVNTDDIPADDFAREIEIESGREDLQGKPEAIRAKIAEGRVKKMLQERVLLEQPYLMDQSKTVAEAVKEAIATIGENIQVRRFVRFTLGEGLEKKVNDLAADVAAATGRQ